MYLVTADEMREMDRRTIEEFALPGRVLMENAGRGAVRFFLEFFGDERKKSVAVIAGSGNNGGDGFVMARYLHQQGVSVTVYLLAEKNRVKGDARVNLDLLDALTVPVVEITDVNALQAADAAIRHHHIWIDALLGTGLNSDVRGLFQHAIDRINELNRPVFSVDIPSGINSDTGQICGTCIHASATATFAFAKSGHLLHPGTEHTGRLRIVDIGVPPKIVEAVGAHCRLLTPTDIAGRLPRRQRAAHKGTTGHLMVVAGSFGKTGAAAMTALSAMRAGAGLVTLAVAKSLNPVLEPQVTEVMTSLLPETVDGTLDESALDRILSLAADKKCIALGPGLGTAEETSNLVRRLVAESPVPLIIDADGLNCLAGRLDAVANARVPVVLTPHPGEMSRLSGVSSAEVQADRVGSARSFARKHGVFLVLKGAATVVADPDGTCFINPTGNSGMASGGMGDVLTGLIAGLLVQGATPIDAACTGVFLHGRSADVLAGDIGPFGYLATDVMDEIPARLGELMSGRSFTPGSWPVTGIPRLPLQGPG